MQKRKPDADPPRAAAAAPGGEVYVVVVRHGERIDEVNRPEWVRIRTDETRHDPLLTENGWKQGGAAATAVRAKLNDSLGVEVVPIVYSSPAARCLSTAAAMAPGLGFGEIIPAYALNCCAAAKNGGVVCFPKGKPSAQTVQGAKLAVWPPCGDPAKIDAAQGRSRVFAKAVVELASQHEPGSVVVMVTHREGIWELQDHCRQKIARQRYCSQHYYAVQGGQITSWDVAAHRRTPTPPRSAGMSDVETALEQGKGTLVVNDPVLLVGTPGASSTAFGEALQSGESVEVCSVVVEGEEESGHFVLVERGNGERGWLAVTAIRRG